MPYRSFDKAFQTISDQYAPIVISAAAPTSCCCSTTTRTYSKVSNKKRVPQTASITDDTVTFDLKLFQEQTRRAVEHLQLELASLRTGRATPGMLDHLKVDIYGERLPLKACAAVTVRDAQLLAVSVFDSNSINAICKSLAESPLGLTPKPQGQEILIPVPRPTADTLKALSKVCRSEGENARVAIRHARKIALEMARNAFSAEDDRRRAEDDVQKITDEYIKEVDSTVAAKERDIAQHNS